MFHAKVDNIYVNVYLEEKLVAVFKIVYDTVEGLKYPIKKLIPLSILVTNQSYIDEIFKVANVAANLKMDFM